MVSCAASSIQLDPALLTKKLTIVAALAVSATAVYLLFGGARNRSKSEEEEDIIDCASSSSLTSPQGFSAAAVAKEKFRDSIAMATENLPETVLHASSDHHDVEGDHQQILLEVVTHEANTTQQACRQRPQRESHPGPPRGSGQASSSSATSLKLLSSSPERACSGQAFSSSTSRRFPSSERKCSHAAAAAARLSPSRNPLVVKTTTMTTSSVGVCTDPVGARDQLHDLGRSLSQQLPMSACSESAPNGQVCDFSGQTLLLHPQGFPRSREPPKTASLSERRMESSSSSSAPTLELMLVKRENIPPPSYDYLEMVSSTLEDSAATVSTSESHMNSQGAAAAAACQICIDNDQCEKHCSVGGCHDLCLPTAACSLSSIMSQSKEPELGRTLNSSQSQQKKKVRWTPNTVEPSGDNQDYRRRPRSTIHPIRPHSPVQRPLTSYACERPRLQSQAAKNTITGTQETIRKNRYNYV